MQIVKKIISWVVVTGGVIYLGIVGMRIYQYYNPEGGFQYVCTQEAKTCKDGSNVMRSGPSCAFATCPEVLNNALSLEDATTIAEKNCLKNGETIGEGVYDEKAKAWLFGAELEEVREGCNPQCVVSEESQEGKIDWLCNGASIDEE